MSSRIKENVFERSFMRAVCKLPKVFSLPKEPQTSVSGSPDRILCVNGRFVALEMKRGLEEALKKKKSLQEHTLNLIEHAGGYAVFVYPQNADAVYRELERIAHEG